MSWAQLEKAKAEAREVGGPVEVIRLPNDPPVGTARPSPFPSGSESPSSLDDASWAAALAVILAVVLGLLFRGDARRHSQG